MADDKIDTTSGLRRMSALEALRKQAASRPKQEDPAVVRARAIEALNKEMREVSQYLGQIGGEISNVKPQAGAPYEVLFLGKIPVTLANAWVDSRPRRVDGQDCCERVYMRYQVNPESPARATLLAGDIAQLEQLLKSLGAEYQMTVEQKNDFGQPRKATFTLNGKILNEIEILADYTNLAVNVEMTNLWRPGKRRNRIPAEKFKEVGDEVARYILGVDTDFEQRLK
ncbi:MAG TPA: hypothetical protein VE085_13670 [Burkholderiales bacterium]|nr:hypothetical protein [Burkholderiales bacterium]